VREDNAQNSHPDELPGIIAFDTFAPKYLVGGPMEDKLNS
jgi:hypothetical protein